jgi:RNA-directed DNA polymerase
MYDRALQALFVMALEPEFEATFEENSYGFRLGRSPIDAMKQIQVCFRC